MPPDRLFAGCDIERGLDPKKVRDCGGGRGETLLLDELQRRRPEPGQGGERDVLGDLHIHEQTFFAPVLGDEGDPPANAAARRVALDRLAAKPDFAGVERIQTEENAGEFRAAGPHETEQAKDLAAVQGEVDVLDDALGAEVARGKQDGRLRCRCAFRVKLLDSAADHQRDHAADVEFPAGAESRQLAVAKHRDVVGHAHDVAENMRNVDHRLAGLAQPLDQAEQPFRFARGQRRGRLVEYDDWGVELQRLGDLDQLAFARRQPLDQRFRSKVEIDLRQKIARAGTHGGPIDQSERSETAAREAVDEDVLGDREIAEEIELLVDEGDACAAGVRRGLRRVGQPVEDHAAAVRPDDTADHVHQRALAGAVLTDQADDAAAAESQADVAQRMDAEECLGDALQRKDVVAHPEASRASRRVRVTSSAAAARMMPPLTTSM